MATHTLPNALATGTARVEYVFHVGGMPWACHTAGLGTVPAAAMRIMFGSETYGASYYADSVSMYPYLRTPGPQTVEMKDGLGTLDGGAWTMEIDDLPAGDSSFPFNQRTNIVGLEGIQCVANPRQDPTIGNAKLWDTFGKASTTLKLDDDFADIIHDGITAAAGDPYLLWINGECVGATAEAAGSGYDLDVTVLAGARGLFRSKTASHHPSSINTAGYIRVCDAPLNGIVGRPAYLWALLVDEDGVLVSDDVPHLLRHGKVGTDIRYTPGKGVWSVQCLPWWKWLDTDIDLDAFEGHLAKFMFSRGPSGTDSPPHMQLREWDGAAADWGSTLDIWLCAADSQVTFDTIEELYEAIADACTAASVADATNSYIYTCGHRGPWTEDGPTTPVSQRPAVRGPLVGICDFGYVPSVTHTETAEWIAGHQHWGNPRNHRWWGQDFDETDTASDGGWQATETPAYSGDNDSSIPRYIVQWFEHDDTEFDEDDGGALGRLFPIPYDSDLGKYALWFDTEIDVSSVADGEYLTIGTDDFWLDTPGPSRSSLSIALVDDVGAGPPSNNYIVFDGDPPDLPEWDEGSHPCLYGQKADGGSDMDDKKFGRSCYLYWRPDLHASDPWPVKQNFDVTVSKPSTLFKALLGDTSEITIPEIVQIDHIPDAISTAQFHPTIDWDSLDEYIDSSSSGFDGLKFRLRYNGRLNIWQMFLNLLRFWGLTPTYEWVEAQKQYRIRFREVGTINSTLAAISGRRLDKDHIARGTSITATHARDWLINSIDLSLWWMWKEDKFKYRLQFGDVSGFSTTGGKRNTLEVQDRITRVNPEVGGNLQALVTHFASILDSTMIPHPTIGVNATVHNVLSFGVGVEALVTADGVHNPYTGVVGLDETPALITSMTCDPSAGTTAYECRIAPANSRGWAPTVRITTSTIDSVDKVSVTDISSGADGQEWCGTGETSAWYDHWFFDALEVNDAMTTPVYSTGVAVDCPVILWTVDDATPTYITGVTCTNVNTKPYASVIGGGEDFFELTGSGWTGSWDVTKDWFMTFANWDHASLPDFAREYIFIADTDGTLNDGSTDTAGEEWK